MTDGPDREPGRSERGSVTVLSAAVLFLAGFLSLVSVDLMRSIQGRALAQTAADAAALAAAQEMAIPSGSTPVAMAIDFAARNGAELISCACEPGGSDAVVRVRVPVAMVMIGGDRTVMATARAVIEGVEGPGPVLPRAGGQTGADR